MARVAAPKVTRILYSRDLNRAQYDRLHGIATLCVRVRGDAWQRCRGISAARQSPGSVDAGEDRSRDSPLRGPDGPLHGLKRHWEPPLGTDECP